MGNSPVRQFQDRVERNQEIPYSQRDIPSDRNHPAFQHRDDHRCEPGILAGWMRTPLTDVFDGLTNVQSDPLCGPMEMKMMNCLEAYGLPKGYRKCDDWMEDFYECISELKRWERLKIMRRERARQFAAGERPVKYAMPPKLGTYQY